MIKTIVTNFLSFDQFCPSFGPKKYDPIYGSLNEAFDEKNSLVQDKNNFNVNMAPKIGLFLPKFAKASPIKHFPTN